MKAARIHAYGGPAELVIDELPQPEPGPGELLVTVRASGINPVDLKVRRGDLAAFLGEPPLTLGWELAGTVAAIGPDVTGFAIGDEVFAMQSVFNTGVHAEAAVLPAAQTVLKPRSLSFEAAAAVPATALAALDVRNAARIEAGERVLVLGAGGSVGHWLLQGLKASGATIVATASAGDLDRLRAAGVADAQDYRAAISMAPIDVVIDLAGGEAQRAAWRYLKPDGRMVSLVPPPQPGPDGRQAQLVMTEPDGVKLARIAAAIDAGTLRPLPVAAVRPLADLARVHAEIEAGELRGKVVLKP